MSALNTRQLQLLRDLSHRALSLCSGGVKLRSGEIVAVRTIRVLIQAGFAHYQGAYALAITDLGRGELLAYGEQPRADE